MDPRIRIHTKMSWDADDKLQHTEEVVVPEKDEYLVGMDEVSAHEGAAGQRHHHRRAQPVAYRAQFTLYKTREHIRYFLIK